MAVTFRISELAADLAVTTRTIRFYEEQGLISPSRRGHERIYTPQERHLLRIALTGKQLGLTLADCRELLALFQADNTNAPTHDELHHQLERVAHYQQFLSEQKRAINTLSSTLNDIKSRCQPSFDTRHAKAEEHSSDKEPSTSYTSERNDSGAALTQHTDKVSEAQEAPYLATDIAHNSAIISDAIEKREMPAAQSDAREKPHVAPIESHLSTAHQHNRRESSSAHEPAAPAPQQNNDTNSFPSQEYPSSGAASPTQTEAFSKPLADDLDLFAPLEKGLDEKEHSLEKQVPDALPEETLDIVVEDDGQLGFLL